ncbi:hypothetical protein [Neoroseomonas rubea]|uniref:hypothetical protein n=1 Tax=Neoroseomonas rubea TaxID=2748666 RepID=UPI0018DFEC49|nr:hypothetical protein [Roseomonas rubea]
MRANRSTAMIAAAAMLAACATPDDYRAACGAEHPDSTAVEDCAKQRAESANTTAVVVTVIGIVAIGAIAAAAAGAGGGSSRDDYSGLCAAALQRC